MIFIVVLAILRGRSTRAQEQRFRAFWDRENEANNTRRADLSQIPGFTFQADSLPRFPEDAELMESYDRILTLSHEKMMNLNGLSNTDLKMSYGPQNLEQLTVYGDNYSALESALLSYAKLLLEKEKRTEAIAVLEKGVMMPTDLMENYTLLGQLYQEENSPHRVEGLKAMAEKNLTGYARDTVLKALTPQVSETAGGTEIT